MKTKESSQSTASPCGITPFVSIMALTPSLVFRAFLDFSVADIVGMNAEEHPRYDERIDS
jgi:hypothetical protein